MRHGRGNPGTGLSRNLSGRRELRSRQAEEYCERESPPDADGESYQEEYSEVGKAHYRGKLRSVLSKRRQNVEEERSRSLRSLITWVLWRCDSSPPDAGVMHTPHS